MTTVVYTDGACAGTRARAGGPGRCPAGRSRSGAEAHSTNQRMEIRAALEAVRGLDGPLEVVSDSTYVVNCFRDRWWEGWLERGLAERQKKPVANRDLWEPLIDARTGRARRRHVPLGEGPQRRPDERPRRPAGGRGGRASRRAATGDGRPSDLGAADVAPSRSTGAARAQPTSASPRATGSSSPGIARPSSAATTTTPWPTACATSSPRSSRPRRECTTTWSCSPASASAPSSSARRRR